jgi:hypothetical protein
MANGLRHTSLGTCAKLWLACASGLLWSSDQVVAQTFFEEMQLVSIDVGGLSSLARSMQNGSGGLSDGSRYSFDRYYSTDIPIPDVRFTMLSPITSDFGILWGFGTGESGDKYRIDPSFQIGFLYIEPLGDNEWLSLSVSTRLWGYFREKPCTANYGTVGGIQTVNCRMADSSMAPSETLDYLEERAPQDQFNISLRYQLRF